MKAPGNLKRFKTVSEFEFTNINQNQKKEKVFVKKNIARGQARPQPSKPPPLPLSLVAQVSLPAAQNKPRPPSILFFFLLPRQWTPVKLLRASPAVARPLPESQRPRRCRSQDKNSAA